MNYEEIIIDRESDVAIAEQIAGRLLRAILDGHIAAGERLPAERDLAELLGVARGTVKRAYARLTQMRAIEMRQGSGSYALHNGRRLEENHKKEASEVIASTFERLRGSGLSDKEIYNLINLHYLSVAGGADLRKISIMVVSNNHDILSELEQQLSYLTSSSPFRYTLSFMTLDTIIGHDDPVQVLLAYDLIIATTIDYQEVLDIAPMLHNRIIEAKLSPRTSTLAELSTLPQDSRVGVVFRTGVFRDMVRRCLLSLGFRRENIFCFHDKEYTPALHSANGDGIGVLINFNESPVYTDPDYAAINDAFRQAGGQILRFMYQIERNSLVLIEDHLQRLLQAGE